MLQFLKKLFAKTNSEELNTAINNGAFLVDVRTTQEFASGHVKGSVNIPLNKIESHLKELKSKKNMVVFCKSGNRSSQAKSILEKNGFTNVTNGGTWQNVNQILKSK